MKLERRKVGTKDFRAMKQGETKVFYIDNALDVKSAQSIAYRLTRVSPERGIRYKTKADYDKMTMTVIAEKV